MDTVTYKRKIGRLSLAFDEYGESQAVTIKSDDGWKDVPAATLTMSVEELRDLQYLAQRAIHHAKKRGQ